MREILRGERALSAARLAELDALIDSLASADPLETEADYVELFDRGRATSLHLFEHVHGDSRDRGPAMIDLAQTYEKAGLYLAPGELPDYLPAVLEFVSTQPPREARAFLGEMAHIFNAHVQRAAASAKARTPACSARCWNWPAKKRRRSSSPPNQPLDESWAEPPVFDGCSSKGQAKPGQPQPIHIVRKNAKHRSGRMNAFESYLHTFLFSVYPYICMVVFLVGSLARFDRDQYTWKSDSSQMLRTGTLRWGSNLFHVGILFLFFGHFVGPADAALGVRALHQRRRTSRLLAIVAGGVAGFICFIGLTPAAASPHVRPAHPPDQPPHRHRDPDHPVGATDAGPDHPAVFAGSIADGSVMLVLADWAQRVVTFRVGGAEALIAAGLAVQGAHGAGHDDLPAVSVQPAGARVERLCHGRLPVPPVPGGAQPPAEPAGRPQPAAPARAPASEI